MRVWKTLEDQHYCVVLWIQWDLADQHLCDAARIQWILADQHLCITARMQWILADHHAATVAIVLPYWSYGFHMAELIWVWKLSLRCRF